MSSSDRDEMNKNLNEIVVPILRQLNFKGSFPHFRRLTADRLNLLTFQFDRNGGGFVIEIANVEVEVVGTSFNIKRLNEKTSPLLRFKSPSIVTDGSFTKGCPNKLISDKNFSIRL